jgi:hypothetical protein
MHTLSSQDPKKRMFFYGMLLTLLILVPSIISIMVSFRGISEQRATGLGAVAGGISEAYAIYGMAFTIVAPIVVIVFFIKSLAPGHAFRSLISWLLIGWSSLMLTYFALGAWIFTSQVWRH